MQYGGAVAAAHDLRTGETTDPTSTTSSSVAERLITVGIVAIPFVVLAVVLSRRSWYPTGDLAYGELRLQSMPRHIPLLGTAGRITDAAGRQGNHPGPLMFWAMWPFYAIFGRSAWAFETAAIAVNLCWTAIAIWLAGMRLRFRTLLVLAAVVLMLLLGFGLDAMSQPWNPWMALYPFLALVFATWATLLGVRWAPVVAVVAGSFSVQSHVGYIVVVLPLVAIALLAPLIHHRREPRPDGSPPFVPVLIAVGAGLLAWSGPLIDLFTAEHHNVGKLVHNFGSPDEPPVGILAAVKALVRTLNPLVGRGSGTTVVAGPAWAEIGVPGIGGAVPWVSILFIMAWIGVGVAVARRRLDPMLDRFNVVLAVSLLTTLFAVSRIFGALYLYVYRWAEILLWLMVLALLWGIARLLSASSSLGPALTRRQGDGRIVAGALAVLIAFAVFTSVQVSAQEIPYRYTWRTERVIAPKVAENLDPDRSYLVRFDDPIYLFGLGFGLILDLERRGFDVGAPVQWRAAVEPHRVRCGGDHDAVLTVVSGLARIEAWRDDPEAVEIAAARPLADGVYEAQRERLRTALAEAGHDIPVDDVESKIYDIFFFDRYGPEVLAETEKLIEAGAPAAVFMTEPDATSATLCD